MGLQRWLTQVGEAIEAHDGATWLVIALSGTCAVPIDHLDDAVFRLEGSQRIELRGNAIVDGTVWSAARNSESVIVEVLNSQDIVVRDLTLTGVTTVTAGADVGAIRIDGSRRIVMSDNILRQFGVDYVRVDDAANANAFAIKMTGRPNSATAQVLVRDNLVTGLRTGQSENITVAGDVSAFAVVGNVIHDVDNIGIDLIGGEDFDGSQARRGIICGNAMGGELDQNPAYEGGDAAAAGVYLDGGGNDCIIALNVVEGFSRGFEIGAEQANPTIRNTHLFGNISDSARGAGLLIGSLDERIDPNEPTDEGTLVERHLIVRNQSGDISTCTEGTPSADEGAAQCEAGSVARRGVEVCVSDAIPDSFSDCDGASAK